MGMYITELYFDKGIPQFKDIKSEFFKNTGLQITLMAYMNLTELTNNERSIIGSFGKDIDKVEDILKNAKDKMELRNLLSNTNNIGPFRFYILDFSPLEFEVEGNTIELLYGIGRYYFPESLIKTLVNLGGIQLDINKERILGERLEKRKRRWTKLKKWKEYKWYNKPRK